MENKYLDIIIKIIARKAKEYSLNNSLSPVYISESVTRDKRFNSSRNKLIWISLN